MLSSHRDRSGKWNSDDIVGLRYFQTEAFAFAPVLSGIATSSASSTTPMKPVPVISEIQLSRPDQIYFQDQLMALTFPECLKLYRRKSCGNNYEKVIEFECLCKKFQISPSSKKEEGNSNSIVCVCFTRQEILIWILEDETTITHEYKPLPFPFEYDSFCCFQESSMEDSMLYTVFLFRNDQRYRLSLGQDPVIQVTQISPVITKHPISRYEVCKNYIFAIDEMSTLIVMDLTSPELEHIYIFNFLEPVLGIAFDENHTKKLAVLTESLNLQFFQLIEKTGHVFFPEQTTISLIPLLDDEKTAVIGMIANAMGFLVITSSFIFAIDPAIPDNHTSKLVEYPRSNGFFKGSREDTILLINSISNSKTIVEVRLPSANLPPIRNLTLKESLLDIQSLSKTFPSAASVKKPDKRNNNTQKIKSSGYGKETRLYFSPFNKPRTAPNTTSNTISSISKSGKKSIPSGYYRIHESSLDQIIPCSDNRAIATAKDGSISMITISAAIKSKLLLNGIGIPHNDISIDVTGDIIGTISGNSEICIRRFTSESDFRNVLAKQSMRYKVSRLKVLENGKFVLCCGNDPLSLELLRVTGCASKNPTERIYHRNLNNFPIDSNVSCDLAYTHPNIYLGHDNGTVSLWDLRYGKSKDGPFHVKSWKLDQGPVKGILEHDINGCKFIWTRKVIYQLDLRCAVERPTPFHQIPFSHAVTAFSSDLTVGYAMADCSIFNGTVLMYDYRFPGRMTNRITFDRQRQTTKITSLAFCQPYHGSVILVTGFEDGNINVGK